MKLKSIKLQIVLRVLLMAISLTFVAYLLVQQGSRIRALYASVIPLVLVFDLILVMDRNNRHLQSYLKAIQWDDMGVKMPEDMKDKSFQDLNKTLNLFNKKLDVLRRENRAQFYFTEALIKDALVGLVVIDQDNRVFFANTSFERLIGIPKITVHNVAETELKPVWNQISNLEINEKRSIELTINGQPRILLFQVSEFIIEKDRFRLYSTQNIKTEVESTEIEAWKKLIRILSHEILNSTSPILSLSNTLSDLIHDNEKGQEELIEQLDEGLDVINQRCDGLIKFTNAFSKFLNFLNLKRLQ